MSIKNRAEEAATLQIYPKRAKLLLLLDFFRSETDEQHPKTVADIIEYLSSKGIEVERKSVYSDIKLLRELDYDVIKVTNGGEVAYFLADELFEQAEAEIFASAVSAAKFVTQKKSTELLNKLSKLFSKEQARVFHKRLELARTKKTKNKEVYYNIDKIVTATNDAKRISFQYFEYLPDKTQQVRKRGEKYHATPYVLMWFEDALYMVCNIDKYDNLSHFRVDRMTNIEVLNEQARHIDEVSEYKNYLDFDEYHSSVFNMFGGQRKNVRIRFHESLATAVFDRFGLDVIVTDIKDGFFTISANVRVSPGFISWLTLFADKAKVLSPGSLIKEIKTMISALTTVYKE